MDLLIIHEDFASHVHTMFDSLALEVPGTFKGSSKCEPLERVSLDAMGRNGARFWTVFPDLLPGVEF